MGVGEVLDASINLYFRNLPRLLLIAAAVMVPVTVLVFLLDVWLLAEPGFGSANGAFYQVGDTIRFLDETRVTVLQIAEAVILVIAYLVIVGATFRAVSQLYLGGVAEPGASLRFAAARIHSLLWISVMTVAAVGIGLLLLVIPGVWLLVLWSVAIPVLMVEDARGTKALSRSSALVRDNWWRTFGALLVGFIFIGLFEFLLGLLAGVADGVSEDSVYLWALIVDVINAFSTLITAPLQAAIITVIYFNLRVRKEGFDVQLLAQGIEGTPVPPQPAPASAAAPTTPPPGSSEPPTTPT
jgi:hypothetical protein